MYYSNHQAIKPTSAQSQQTHRGHGDMVEELFLLHFLKSEMWTVFSDVNLFEVWNDTVLSSLWEGPDSLESF